MQMKGILLETLRWLIFDEILEYILHQVFDALIDSYTFPSVYSYISYTIRC